MSPTQPCDQDEWKLTGPGRRTGRGSESVLRYLRQSLATKPGDLLPADACGSRERRRSLMGWVRRALRRLLPRR